MRFAVGARFEREDLAFALLTLAVAIGATAAGVRAGRSQGQLNHRPDGDRPRWKVW
jgi:hypothetical protein